MNKHSVKIIFFGTSDFAAVILNKLLQTNSYQLIALVTQPDKPVGRKKILTPPPVKVLAQQKNVPVIQPEKLDSDFNKKISAFKPQLFIVAAYGNLLPALTLAIPKYGALNIHPSLLPKYRGPSPMQTALLNGDIKTGVTIIKMDEKMDHGAIISNYELRIMNYDNYKTLSEKLAKQGADLLINTILDYISGNLKPTPQDDTNATFTKIIKKQDGLITKEKTAAQIYNMYRAYQLWPGIFLKSGVKLLDIEPTTLKNKTNSSLELFAENKNLYLSCAHNSVLKINKLQPQGKNMMSAQSFINGYMK